MAKIELLSAYSGPCFLGQAIPFYCRFDNPNRHDCLHLHVASKQSNEHSWNPFKNVTGFQYHPHQTVDVLSGQQTTAHRITVPNAHRGQQTIGQIRLSVKSIPLIAI